MNNFTKTDLSEIHRCLKYMTKGGTTPYSCHTIALVKKVRTLIENYADQCNHYWEVIHPEIKLENEPLTYNSPKIRVKCKHCGIDNA